MTVIAVLNRSAADDRDVAFWSEAWNVQAREVAGVWGVEYTPVVFFSSADGLPAADCRILTILPDVDVPGALGYHDIDGGAVFAEIKFTGPDTSTTGSHEVLEELVDPLCSRWAPYDVDHEQAIEICDRTESDSYPQSVIVLGETRDVRVSNYLLPAAFGEASGPPFDRLGKLIQPNEMTVGGYVILRDITTGKVGNVFASFAAGDEAAAATIQRKRDNPRSRVSRRGPLKEKS